MYPQVFLLGFALIKKDRSIAGYGLLLSSLGALVSAYQVFISYVDIGSFCETIGGISCTKQYVAEFGYITIPVMALTAFLLMIIFLAFTKLKKGEEN